MVQELTPDFLQAAAHHPNFKQRDNSLERQLGRMLERLRVDPTSGGSVQELVPVMNTVEGYWRDIISRNGKVVEIGDWHSNLVVNAFANLIAALTLGNGAGGVGTTWAGVQYLAIGTNVAPGGYAGTSGTTASAADVALLNESYRQAIDNAFFSTNTGAVVSPGPTPNITVTCTIPAGAGNFVLQEFGLFGGNASGTRDSGIMIDRVTHGIIDKSQTGNNDFDLTRIVTLIY